MFDWQRQLARRLAAMLLTVVLGALGVFALALFLGSAAQSVTAASIAPPEGYPKFILSTKIVSPTLAHTDGSALWYEIQIVNSGAYTAEGVVLSDSLPAHTTYSGQAGASAAPAPIVENGVLTWTGTVGFDASVVITFGVQVDAGYAGIISNTAVISHPLIARPVFVTARTVVTDDPILALSKTSVPAIPGAQQPMTYTITVINQGQLATGLPITVTDKVPTDTTLLEVGADGQSDLPGQVITWTRAVTLAHLETTVFTFSVQVNDVTSGTVIANPDYQLRGPFSETIAGAPYTVTVLDPIFLIAKHTWPDPPGSNRELTYTLTVLNKGSLASQVVVSDVVPTGVTYLRGGDLAEGTVSWEQPSLDTGQVAQFTYTVAVTDVAQVTVLNDTYGVCSQEEVCAWGSALPSLVEGPTFLATSTLDPIAKKPGGGGGPVTPTLTIQNIGPGNALEADAWLYFGRISISLNNMVVNPPRGQLSGGFDCGDRCTAFHWVGDLAMGETITFTVDEGQSTIGGDPGVNYTATVLITDSLGIYVTDPVTATLVGHITHDANLLPYKSAPAVIGAGQVLTYSLQVFNSGLSTATPPFPVLTDTLPLSTTLVQISDGGVSQTIGGQTVISWTLPSMSPGDVVKRSFSVLVDPLLISGTAITNDHYGVLWNDTFSNTGQVVTTTVREVGLVDSFKDVTPALARPGPDNLITYVVHVVNSSPVDLIGVQVHDALPWQNSTYRRDAQASSGQIISDIVSVDWLGNVAAFSSELLTLTVLVDDGYEGALTNTAVISHSSLLDQITVSAAAYISDKPVLKISKTVAPDSIAADELWYTLRVENLGQQATELLITDTLPANTDYIADSASGGGVLIAEQVQWELPALPAFGKQTLTFRVKVLSGRQVVNRFYGVSCAEGVSATGAPVAWSREEGVLNVYLPLILR